MKKHSTKLVPAALVLLGLLSNGLGQSPTPAARKQLDKVIENTRAFDNSDRGRGGSTIDTSVRPSTATVPSTAVRPSTTTVPSTTLTKPTGTTPNSAPRRPSIDHIYVPSPVVKSAPPQTKEKPKTQPTTGTVSTGGK